MYTDVHPFRSLNTPIIFQAHLS